MLWSWIVDTWNDLTRYDDLDDIEKDLDDNVELTYTVDTLEDDSILISVSNQDTTFLTMQLSRIQAHELQVRLSHHLFTGEG